ncbi:hypothetical protein [Peptostreptococcus faecalis]|uniref:hypothetical protein n=1 Tax=Peptostreptococcus faecalis TaxID=2045015 RepID=UPI0011AF5181|nr:hypothetical protein [Peptostreptococcus faecalis]
MKKYYYAIGNLKVVHAFEYQEILRKNLNSLLSYCGERIGVDLINLDYNRLTEIEKVKVDIVGSLLNEPRDVIKEMFDDIFPKGIGEDLEVSMFMKERMYFIETNRLITEYEIEKLNDYMREDKEDKKYILQMSKDFDLGLDVEPSCLLDVTKEYIPDYYKRCIEPLLIDG